MKAMYWWDGGRVRLLLNSPPQIWSSLWSLMLTLCKFTRRNISRGFVSGGTKENPSCAEEVDEEVVEKKSRSMTTQRTIQTKNKSEPREQPPRQRWWNYFAIFSFLYLALIRMLFGLSQKNWLLCSASSTRRKPITSWMSAMRRENYFYIVGFPKSWRRSSRSKRSMDKKFEYDRVLVRRV